MNLRHGDTSRAPAIDDTMDTHKWLDDSMQPQGRSWEHGVRFVCSKCHLERRRIEDDKGNARYVYFRGTSAIRGTLPPCIGRA